MARRPYQESRRPLSKKPVRRSEKWDPLKPRPCRIPEDVVEVMLLDEVKFTHPDDDRKIDSIKERGRFVIIEVDQYTDVPGQGTLCRFRSQAAGRRALEDFDGPGPDGSWVRKS